MQKKLTKLVLNQETLRNITQKQQTEIKRLTHSCDSNCHLACTPVIGVN